MATRILLALLLLATAPPAPAQGMSIIRDAEIEATLGRWNAPLLRAANMAPGSVDLVIVQSPDINAFVAGGANIFVFTGLLLEARGPEEITGVLAHELGHITGGHLIAGREAARRASYEAMLAQILGVAVGAATGEGGAAAAISAGGTHKATRDYLTHSRGQESSADQAALTFLARAGVDPQGLPSFLAHLGQMTAAPASPGAAYTRTHPLTRDRLAALETRVRASPKAGAGMGAAQAEAFRRMQAKLRGFLYPQQVAGRYPRSDTSVAARYARAIAAYRGSRIIEALAGVDGLLRAEPANPYFLELKGQILLEAGRASEAVPYYKRAVAAAPSSGLIRIALGHALLESGRAAEAAEQLSRAVRDEPRSALAHRLLATAYGKTGELARARLHLAEEALLRGRRAEARAHADAALKGLPPGSPAAIQASDILAALDL